MRAVHRTLVSVIVLTLLALPAGAQQPSGGAPAGAPPPAGSGGAVACDDVFADVGCDHLFYGEVRWLTDRGLAAGYADGTFRPGTALSRQALAALLFRAAGSPPGPFDPPAFSDVPDTHLFADEIAWAVSEGLVEGHPDGTFRPTATASRHATAVILHRRAGSPAVTVPVGGPFPDVPAAHQGAEAITWLAQQGSGGFPDGTFRPSRATTRGTLGAILARFEVATQFDPATADRCEFLDPTECLLMWPTDHLTVADATTDTGRRLALDIASMPVSQAQVPVDPVEMNRNDGFSPGSVVIVRIPGIDLEVMDAPPIGRLSRSLEDDSPIVLLDADTGERHPFWAELDSAATSDADRSLHLRPAVNLAEGHRYVVAFRGVVDGDGEPIEPSATFRSYRDRIETLAPAMEARRPAMEQVFADLDAADVRRDDLFLAWDFTVASERNLSERMLHLRDDAFADLGDEAPTFAVTSVVEPPVEEDANIARQIEATVEVPLYLTGTGAPGSSFNWGASGLPERNGSITANVTCRVPRSASAENPARISLYGHGLLGRRTEVNAGNVRAFAQEHNIVFCATDWIGMANEDIANVAGILTNLSNFHTLADRVQQGILNTLFLGRAMKHEDGFATDAAFQDEGEPLIDTSELFYDSNSQGAIIGGAATAVAQDWTRAVLGVPGMNYSLLLKRSSDWPVYESIMQTAYPDKLDQALLLAMIQLMWDRAETNGYAHHITSDPYPNTPEHQVLLHVAYADHQVTMWSAEIEGRTIGAHVRQPALAPGRHPDEEPLWNLPAVPGEDFTGSVLVYWDSGTPPPPQTNQQPTEGDDPHSRPRAQATARTQKSAFFDGVFVDVCGDDPCLAP